MDSALELEEIYKINLPTEEIQNKRMKTYNLIRDITERNLHQCRCSQYGSIRSGIDLYDSDLDISIDGRNNLNEYRKLSIIAKALENVNGIDQVSFISSAKIPIVKVYSSSTYINTDISCRGEDGKLCHLYLTRYVTPKISVMIEVCRIIKIWSKSRNLIPSSCRGLSQFGWMCICVFYSLQHYNDFVRVSSYQGIQRFDGIIKLLYFIFNDLVNTNWMEYTISPLTGRYIRREEKGVKYNSYGLNQISIESPFHTDIDIALSIDTMARIQIIEEAKRAIQLLKISTGDSIRMLFNQPTNIYEPLSLVRANELYLIYSDYDKGKPVRYFYVTDTCLYDENKEDYCERKVKGYLLDQTSDIYYFTRAGPSINVSMEKFICLINFIKVDDVYLFYFIEIFYRSFSLYTNMLFSKCIIYFINR